MDELAKYNSEEWNRLVDANVDFSGPWDQYSVEELRKVLDGNNILPLVTCFPKILPSDNEDFR